MQDFEDDDPSQLIVIDEDTDASSDVDDLSEVSMASAGGIGKQEFQGLLSDIAAQHQRMAASLDALASRVEDMSVEQVEEAAVRVISESGHVRGLEEITRVFDKSESSVDPGMWGTQIPGVPSLEREAGGQRHHLLQAAAKEIWHQ